MNSTNLTGQRFGMLQVLGKGEGKQCRTYYCYTYRLQCDCGNIIELPRSAFDRKGNTQKSCGCYRKAGFDNKRRPIDITGQRFGSLIAVALTGKRVHRKPTWLMKCE